MFPPDNDKFLNDSILSRTVPLNDLMSNPKRFAQLFLAECGYYPASYGIEKEVLKSKLQVMFQQVMKTASQIPAHLLVRCICLNPLTRVSTTRTFSSKLDAAIKELAQDEPFTDRQEVRLNKLIRALESKGLLQHTRALVTNKSGKKQEISPLLLCSHSRDMREQILQSSQHFRVTIPVSDRFFPCVTQFFETGTFAKNSLSPEEILAFWREVREDGQYPLPKLARLIEEALADHISYDNLEDLLRYSKDPSLSKISAWVNSNYQGIIELQTHDVYSSLELNVHEPCANEFVEPLTSACSRFTFTDFKAFQDFLLNNQSKRFRHVQALKLGFAELLPLQETKRLLQLFPNLKTLQAKACSLPKGILRKIIEQSKVDCLVIKDCESLNHLDLGDKASVCFFVGEKVPPHEMLVEKVQNSQLIYIPKQLPENTRWSFEILRNISNHHLLTLIDLCPQIFNVMIEHSPKLTDKAISTLVQKCHKLREIEVSFCPGLTNEALFQIARHCSRLRWLDISGNAQFTDEGLIAISKHCLEVALIFLSYCTSLTDTSLLHFLKERRYLNTIELIGCSKLTDQVIRHIISQPLAISLLGVKKEHFSDGVLKEFINNNPQSELQVKES